MRDGYRTTWTTRRRVALAALSLGALAACDAETSSARATSSPAVTEAGPKTPEPASEAAAQARTGAPSVGAASAPSMPSLEERVRDVRALTSPPGGAPEGNLDAFAGAEEPEGGELVVGRGADGMGMRGSGSAGCGMGEDAPSEAPRSVVAFTERTLSGKCFESNVVRVLKNKSSALRYCHTREQGPPENIQGDVTFSWTFGATGRVSDVELVGSTIGSGALEHCIERVIARMRFRPPESDTCVVEQVFSYSVE